MHFLATLLENSKGTFIIRYIIKPRSKQICSFVSRLQELNVYLAEFPPEGPGDIPAALPTEEVMDMIYHTMPNMWKNNMIE